MKKAEDCAAKLNESIESSVEGVSKQVVTTVPSSLSLESGCH